MGIGMRPRHGRRNLQTDRVNCVGEAIGVTGFAMGLGRLLKHVDELIVVSHLATLVPTGKCDPTFLMYWLRQNSPTHLIKDAAYPSIRLSEISQLQVPRIKLEEQQRITVLRSSNSKKCQFRADFTCCSIAGSVMTISPKSKSCMPLSAAAQIFQGCHRIGPPDACGLLTLILRATRLATRRTLAAALKPRGRTHGKCAERKLDEMC
jgi:hypothetical protein